VHDLVSFFAVSFSTQKNIESIPAQVMGAAMVV
jgi:hypothetical protein